MKLNKALFCLAVICITTTLAAHRHIPDRSNIFTEERHSNSLPFLRNLASASHNSHHKSSNQTKVDPVTVRLQGNTDLGYYYVTLFFGSPLQKQTLIVDTGSTTTTIPCSECGKECGTHHFDRPFNHKNSKSFEEFKCAESFGEYSCYDCDNKCPFSVSYVEGSSYSGHFNKDFIAFGNEIEDNFSILNKIEADNESEKKIREAVEEVAEDRKIFMPFGCTNRETKLFYDQEADGILGLGVKTNTGSSPPNLLDALHLHNEGANKAFSLCLAQDGGYFTIGGYNAAYHLPEEQTHYTRFSDAFDQYKVFLHKIEIEGQDVGLKPEKLNSGDGAFFDSGTTLTHVPRATYDALRGNMQTFCESDPENCGNNARSDSNSYCWIHNRDTFPNIKEFYETFPTFKFFFGKENPAEYEWKAEDYLYLKDEDKNLYCLGLSHYERETILGGTFMKNHDILFDKENKRIGFVRANCNGVQQVSKPEYLEKEVPAESNRPEETYTVLHVISSLSSSQALETTIIVCVVGLLVCATLGATVYIYKRYKKTTPYQNMRNIRIEIPNSGLSEPNLDVSGAETPQGPSSQPPQEEKVGGESILDESSPNINIEISTQSI